MQVLLQSRGVDVRGLHEPLFSVSMDAAAETVCLSSVHCLSVSSQNAAELLSVLRLRTTHLSLSGAGVH